MKKKILIAAAALVVLVAGGVAAWLLVVNEEEQEARGTCDAGTYELTVEKDDGDLEVAFELTTATVNESWTVMVQQGETTLFEGERLSDTDGEIDVEVLADEDGSDSFLAVANPVEGDVEPCTARVSR